MKGISTKKLVIISLLIALEVIFTRIFSIQTQTVRISFGFLPLAICAAMFGPIYGAIAAVIGDLLGFVLFPRGTFFPGFTLTAAFSGALYGVFLHKKPKKILTVSFAVVSVLLTQLILNTIWLYIMFEVSVVAMLPTRVMTTLVMIPIQVSTILFFWHFTIKKVESSYN